MNELERRFGDPWDDANPAGFRAIVAADERDELPVAGERVLDDYRLGAEFVPPELGGRLTRMDQLIRVLRPVSRRDPSLALSAVSSFIAAVNVWTAGGSRHRRRVADVLLSGERVAAAYHELAHGNDLAGTRFTARPTPRGLLLTGRKEVIANIDRAAALVLFVRTSPAPGSRSHSQVVLESSAIDPAAYLPRFATSGLRGVRLGGIELRDCLVGPESVLGRPGEGIETAMRSFQVTRVVLSGAAVGSLDTGLRTALRFTLHRRLYGRTVAVLPLVRATLAEVFVDLLICDCLTLVAARALHLLPAQCSGYAAAVKAFVPSVLLAAMNRLALVLGAHFYVREGGYAIFGKHLRDLPPAVFGHAARAVCQLTVLFQLPRLARRSWLSGEEPVADLFRLGPDADLPPPCYDRLALTSTSDVLVAAMLPAAATHDDNVRGAAAPFVDELRALRCECVALAPRDVGAAAGPAAFDLVERYTTVLAASACLNVWRHSTDRFLADPRWILAALHRLGPDRSRDLPADIREWLVSELLDRYQQARGFDLAAQPVAG
jgi:alkylation response protein AidB-like acyl-CoA dehydrogenase